MGDGKRQRRGVEGREEDVRRKDEEERMVCCLSPSPVAQVGGNKRGLKEHGERSWKVREARSDEWGPWRDVEGGSNEKGM